MTRFSGNRESKEWARRVESRLDALERSEPSPRQLALLNASELRAAAAGFLRVDDLRFVVPAVNGTMVTEDLGSIEGPRGSRFGVLLGLRIEVPSSVDTASFEVWLTVNSAEAGASANRSGFMSFGESVWLGGSASLVAEVSLYNAVDADSILHVTVGWGGRFA